MEKRYLAGFGNPPRRDTISLCKGYFMALIKEGLLEGKLVTGEVPAGEGDYPDVFSQIYGNDFALWKMLTAKVKKEKKNSLAISVIRAEVAEITEDSVGIIQKVRLNNHVVNFKKYDPNLEFVIYFSDIEAKS